MNGTLNLDPETVASPLCYIFPLSAMVSKLNTANYSSTSPTHNQESLLEISEAPPHSSSPSGGLKHFPPAIKFILWSKFCERFSYHGLEAILALFLSEHLGLSQVRATQIFHLFTMAGFVTPILGAVISDSFWGKYRTILYLSLVYVLGIWVTSMAAIPDLNPVTQKASSYVMWSTAAGLLLTAVGAGGVKPCVPAFGGDQIRFSVPDGHTKERLRMAFFSAFYFAVNVGAFVSILLTPLLRTDVSYAAAFGITALLMGFSVVILWAGRKAYVDRQAVGGVFSTVAKVIVSAVRLRKGSSGYANYEQVNCKGGSSSAGHWLDAAKLKCSAEEVEDVKALMRVCVFFLPASLFWCLHGQKASTWVFQAKQMNGHVSWLGNVVIRPDQMQALTPLLVLIFIPLFDEVIYPFLKKYGVLKKATKRIILGMLLSSVAFLTSGLLQLAIDKRANSGSMASYVNTFSDSAPDHKDHMVLLILANPTEKAKQMSILWQVPQHVIMTAAEVLFSVTGLEFAYSQAPLSMKSVVQAVWCLTTAAGEFVTVLIVGVIGNKLSIAKRSYVFAVGGIIAMMFMVWLGACFNDSDNSKDGEVRVTGDSEDESIVT